MKSLFKQKYFAYFFNVTLFFFIQAVIGNFILNLFQYQFDFGKTVGYVGEHSFLFILSTCILFVLFYFLYALIGRLDITFILNCIFVFGFGYTNYVKITSRFEPMYPEELVMLTKLNLLLDFVSDVPIWWILLSVVIFIGIAMFIFYVIDKHRKVTIKYLDRKVVTVRAVILISTGFLLVNLYQFNEDHNLFRKVVDKKAHWLPESQIVNYETNGFILGFIYNFPSKVMERPAEYSKVTMLNLYDKYKNKADEINLSRENDNLDDVNVIYVMNESFSDPERMNGISIDEDPIPVTRALMERYSSGYAYATNYGGGTANIEFEALTSLALNNLTPQTTTPFQMLDFKNKYPAVTKELFDANHIKTAIHPYSPHMYKRATVYPELGFDQFISMENIKNAWGKENSEFIADEATYVEAIDTMNETTYKDFIHIVTMQNHAGWDEGRYDNQFKITGLKGNYKKEAEEYIQGIAYSDEAISNFINELEDYPEKVMLVFWGDHLLGFYPENILDKNKKRTLRETPLFVYTNFETKKVDLETISPIFFANSLLDISNTKVTPFYALMTELQTEIHVYERTMLIDSSDKKITKKDLTTKQKQLIEDYKLIQYDVIEGENYFNLLTN